MKELGWLVTAGGVIYLIVAFNMDVSVSTGGLFGGEVANLDLMARRQNHVIIAALITLVGVLMVIFGKSADGEVSAPRQAGKPTTVPPFEGDRELTNDPYRLWLADTYNIKRNEVFDRFILGDRTFETLEAALESAHRLEVEKERAKLKDKEEAHARLAELRAERAAAIEEAEARWEETKPKVIVGGIIVLLLVVGLFFALRETPEEREVRLATEEAAKGEMIADAEERLGLDLPEDAEIVRWGEATSEDSYLCGDQNEGLLLEYDTDESDEATKDRLAAKLGDGTKQYSFMPDDFDWEWDKEGKDYFLSFFPAGDRTTNVNLCITS